VTESDSERYPEARAFAREVNLPLLGDVDVAPLPPGAGLADLLQAPVPASIEPVVASLAETRQSLTLHSVLLAGYAHDPELFALGLGIAREWGRKGLRTALVDLNFWSPAVIRPADQPQEGLVDMLEFGCSFRRVAWEVVAERLFVVTPGSYLPDADRIADHPDWDRVSRALARSVDVALFVAPLLERSGYLGRLSKRMDGVIVGTSVARVPRARLRDSFLELWGSDAPMIGCVGIRTAVKTPAGAAGEPVRAPAAPALPAGAVPPPAAPPAPPASAPPVASAPPPAPTPPAPAERGVRGLAGKSDEALVAELTREALQGTSLPARRPRNRILPWAAGIALIASCGGAALWLHAIGFGRAAFHEAQPTGTDQVLPADLGAPGGGLPAEPADSVAAGSLAAPAAQADALPFHVHVASFRSESTVRQIADSLRAQGLDAWYEPAADLPGWYRVFVGRFATYDEAAAEAESLLHRGLVDRAQAFPEQAR
jgi:cell division septation protein DedD